MNTLNNLEQAKYNEILEHFETFLGEDRSGVGMPALEKLRAAIAQLCAKPDSFQSRVAPWMQECFGPVISADQVERNHRFLEEALELVQACGCSAGEAHQLVEYVYGRPLGDKPQEVGGVMVTLAALCLAQEIDMYEAGEIELARIWTKVPQIRAKQALKPKNSPLPEAKPDSAEQVPDVRLTVNRFLGWPLPKTFSPDCGISFDGRKDDEWNKSKQWPIGTNLLTADEAKEMFEYVLKSAAPLNIAQQAPDWKEIDSAPRDGSHFMARRRADCLPMVVHWFEAENGFFHSSTDAANPAIEGLTEWRPLP